MLHFNTTLCRVLEAKLMVRSPFHQELPLIFQYTWLFLRTLWFSNAPISLEQGFNNQICLALKSIIID